MLSCPAPNQMGYRSTVKEGAKFERLSKSAQILNAVCYVVLFKRPGATLGL